MPNKGRGMIFGVFDLLHPGHIFLLYHARMKGKELVAVIARDSVVRKLKGRKTNWNEKKRLRVIRMTGLATKAVLGDSKEGEYEVIKKYKPDFICLGYDQRALKKDLLAKMRSNKIKELPLYTLKPYQPKKFHTSIQRGLI